MDDSSEDELTRRVVNGDVDALGAIFTLNRDRLLRMVELRLDRRLKARIDPSDVIQEGYADALKKLSAYRENPKLPVFLWLRLVVGERLLKLRRTHLGTRKRDAGREIPLDVATDQSSVPLVRSAVLAARLIDTATSPSQLLQKADLMAKLQAALAELGPLDREIIALRNFEMLSRTETALALGIDEAAAAKRYIRAIQRLRHVFGDDSDSIVVISR